MTLAPPSSSPGVQPLQLPWDLRLNADLFERVCQANPDVVLELSADGQVIAMTPTGSETGARNQALGGSLWLAIRRHGLPLKAFDSSSGFRLPDGSVLSPYAAPQDGRLHLANGARLGWLLLSEERGREDLAG